MESPHDPSSTTDDAGMPAPPPRDGKLQRIASHTQGLVTDLREWIDLRLDLAIIEMEERVNDLRNELALGVALAILGFFGAFFGLTTVALGLGWLLGHPFWGFLIVAALLILLAVTLRAARPELLRPTKLFQRFRGGASSPSESDRPSRRAAASVEDRSASEGEGAGPSDS